MGDRYLKTVFGIMGVNDFTTIHADSLDIIGQDVEAIMGQASEMAFELVISF